MNEEDEIPRHQWSEALELLTKDHEGDEVTIEVMSGDLGNQHEAEKLPLTYIDYDTKDDTVIVAVGGRDSRYPVVLRHIIAKPQAILFHPPDPNAAEAIEVVDGQGAQTILTLHRHPPLPSPR
jgi:hypothetical protein